MIGHFVTRGDSFLQMIRSPAFDKSAGNYALFRYASVVLDVFYKSYLYAFCPINTEYIIAQLKRNILEKDISTEEKQQEINNFDSLVEKTKCFTLDNHKFIIYKISIIRE